MPRRAALACIAIAALLVSACGRRAPAGPAEVPLAPGEAPALLWEPAPQAASNEPVPFIILAAPGTDPRHWDALAAPAAHQGCRVLVCPAPAAAAGPPGTAYPARFDAARAALGGPPAAECVVLAESTAASPLLGHIADGTPLLALIAISPSLDPAAEAGARNLRGTPLLLIACENDLQAATAARALKDTAATYCELQAYPCGVRGADLLAAAPGLPQQVLAWLRPIIPPR